MTRQKKSSVHSLPTLHFRIYGQQKSVWDIVKSQMFNETLHIYYVSRHNHIYLVHNYNYTPRKNQNDL
jgi:hypothetical protein